MTWTWATTQSKYIKGYNLVSIRDISLDECIKQCEAQLDPCCVSADYDGLNVLCSLNAVDHNEVPLTDSTHGTTCYISRIPPCEYPSHQRITVKTKMHQM